MKRRFLALFVVFSILLCMNVPAADDRAYIFETTEAISDEALLCRVRQLAEGMNLYCTESPAVLWELQAAGQLLMWEEDAEVVLTETAGELPSAEAWPDAMLGMEYADRNGITGEGVRIGLIDSGVRSDFAQLTGADVGKGVNYLASVGSSARADTNDLYGHGSFVASILVSSQVGIAPGAELIPLKCFDGKSGSMSVILSAIYDAVNVFHVDVLNMSLGIGSDKASFYQAIRYAYDAGVIIVAASGNLGSSAVSTGRDPYYYPAAYVEVIGVGSVGDSGDVSRFSYQNDSVLIAAPGEGVYGFLRSGGLTAGRGTSYATPYAAGAAALARSIAPSLTPDAFMHLLAETAEDRGIPGFDNAYGNGLLNIGLLLAVLREDTDDCVLSGSSGSRSVSACIPENGSGYLLVQSSYDADGRFLGTETIQNGEGGLLRNLRVPEGSAEISLLIVDPETWEPIRSGIRAVLPG